MHPAAVFFIASVLMAQTALTAPQSTPGNRAETSSSSYTQAVFHTLAGTVAESDNNTLVAAEHTLHALAEDPDNLMLRQKAFELSMLNGDVDTAVRLAASLPPGMGNDTLPLLTRAMVAAKKGNLKDAAELSKRASRIAPTFLQFRLLDAYIALAEGTPTAKIVAKLQKQKMPKEFEARRLYHIGRMWLNAGDSTKARAALEKSNAMEPGALFTTLQLADLDIAEGRPADAEKLYATFRNQNPSIPLLQMGEKTATSPLSHTIHADKNAQLNANLSLTLFDFGLMVWAQGASEPAAQILNLSNWIDNSNSYLRYYNAVVNEAGGRENLAVSAYKNLEKDPSTGYAARLRLASLMFPKNPETSIQALENLTQENPTSIAAHRTLADMLVEQKKYAKAIKQYRKVLGLLTPENATPRLRANLWYSVGACYERLGKIDKASEALQESLKAVPTDPQVLNYLGYTWVENGINLPQANAMLQKALMLAPEDGAIVDSVGWALYKQKDYARARLYLEQAIELEPDDPTVISHLGDVYQALGRGQDAEQQWKKALNMLEKEDPENLRPELERKLKKPFFDSWF